MPCPVVDEHGRGVMDALQLLDMLRQRMLDALREFDVDGAFDVEGVAGFAAGHREIMAMGRAGVGPQGGRITEVP